MSNKDKDSRNDNPNHVETVTAPSATPEVAQFADFLGVDSPDVVLDLTAVNPTDVINPDPDLQYGLVNKIRGGRRKKAIRENWLFHPPDKDGKLAQTTGENEDCDLCAMRKDLFDARKQAIGDKARAKIETPPADNAGSISGTGATNFKQHVIKRRM